MMTSAATHPNLDLAGLSFAALNSMDADRFAEALDGLVENAPWVLRAAADARPVHSPDELLGAIRAAIDSAPTMARIALLRGHPELAGVEAMAGTMTSASTGEQDRLGLTRLSAAEAERLSELNARYRATFGFPCIIALRRHPDLASVLGAFERRLGNGHDEEIAVAVEEITEVVRGRIEARLPAMGEA